MSCSNVSDTELAPLASLVNLEEFSCDTKITSVFVSTTASCWKKLYKLNVECRGVDSEGLKNFQLESLLELSLDRTAIDDTGTYRFKC